MDVTVLLNQSVLIANRNHFASSGDVFVDNWVPVLAVILTRESSKVLSAHHVTMAINAVLPMSCPEETMILQGRLRVSGSLKCRPISSSTSACHLRGPEEPDN